MASVNMHEAKTHLSRLMAKVEQGESITISRSGKPVARLVPIREDGTNLEPFGFLKGQIRALENIKTPFQEEIEEMFYGNPHKFNKGI